MLDETEQRGTERGPLLHHIAVVCVRLAVPVLTCLGLVILLIWASTAGLATLIGCLCYLMTRNLTIVYGVSLGFAVVWVVVCEMTGGIDIGPMTFHSHQLLRIGNLPPFAINLVISLLFAILGIKIGYALRDACRRARSRIKDLEIARSQQATPE